jgi:hypothetical protein
MAKGLVMNWSAPADSARSRVPGSVWPVMARMRVRSPSLLLLPPGEHPPRFGRQHGQHPELRRGQLDGSPADPRRLPGQVQVQAADLPDRVRLPVQPPAPQDRPDPADHLGHRERLAQVIIGAGLQADYPVRLTGQRGQHQHRNRAALPYPPAHLHPGQARQHHVKDQQVIRPGPPAPSVRGEGTVMADRRLPPGRWHATAAHRWYRSRPAPPHPQPAGTRPRILPQARHERPRPEHTRPRRPDQARSTAKALPTASARPNRVSATRSAHGRTEPRARIKR